MYLVTSEWNRNLYTLFLKFSEDLSWIPCIDADFNSFYQIGRLILNELVSQSLLRILSLAQDS